MTGATRATPRFARARMVARDPAPRPAAGSPGGAVRPQEPPLPSAVIEPLQGRRPPAGLPAAPPKTSSRHRLSGPGASLLGSLDPSRACHRDRSGPGVKGRVSDAPKGRLPLTLGAVVIPRPRAGSNVAER